MEKKFTDLGDRKRWWRNLTNIRTERRVRTQQEKFSREKFLRLNTDFHRHCWCGAEDFTGGEHWRGRKATEDGNLRGKIKWGEVGWAGICKAKDLLAWTLHRHIEVERSFPHQKAACCLSLSLSYSNEPFGLGISERRLSSVYLASDRLFFVFLFGFEVDLSKSRICLKVGL